MKKTIVLLLSLILLFSFVSCNGSTNSPSDSGSSNNSSNNTNTDSSEIVYEEIPSDPPSSSSTLVDLDESTKSSIDDAISKIKKTVNKRYEIRSYNFKDDAKIGDKKINGNISFRMDYVEGTMVYNGTLSYDGNQYKLTEYKLPMSETPSVISGSFKINNNDASISDFVSLNSIFSPIFSTPDPNNFSEIIGYVYEESQLTSKNSTNTVIGQQYNESKFILSKKVDETNNVIRGVIGDKSLVYKHSYDNTKEESEQFKIIYLGFNGKYFKEDSLKTNYPNGIHIY